MAADSPYGGGHVPVSQGTNDVNEPRNGHQQLTQNLPDMVALPGTNRVRPATRTRQAQRQLRWRDCVSGAGQAVAVKMGCTWDGGEQGEDTVQQN